MLRSNHPCRFDTAQRLIHGMHSFPTHLSLSHSWVDVRRRLRLNSWRCAVWYGLNLTLEESTGLGRYSESEALPTVVGATVFELISGGGRGRPVSLEATVLLATGRIFSPIPPHESISPEIFGPDFASEVLTRREWDCFCLALLGVFVTICVVVWTDCCSARVLLSPTGDGASTSEGPLHWVSFDAASDSCFKSKIIAGCDGSAAPWMDDILPAVHASTPWVFMPPLLRGEFLGDEMLRGVCDQWSQNSRKYNSEKALIVISTKINFMPCHHAKHAIRHSFGFCRHVVLRCSHYQYDRVGSIVFYLIINSFLTCVLDLSRSTMLWTEPTETGRWRSNPVNFSMASLAVCVRFFHPCEYKILTGPHIYMKLVDTTHA